MLQINPGSSFDQFDETTHDEPISTFFSNSEPDSCTITSCEALTSFGVGNPDSGNNMVHFDSDFSNAKFQADPDAPYLREAFIRCNVNTFYWTNIIPYNIFMYCEFPETFPGDLIVVS